MRVLITGGVKSGKSSFAVSLAEERFTERFFLATGVAFDDEMQQRIEHHRRERNGRFQTIEEPVEIHSVLQNDMIVDDITVWLNNLFYRNIEERWETIIDQFIEKMPERVIVVTNETGMGNIPLDGTMRKYNRYLGAVNKRLAASVDEVYLMVCGIPVKIKERDGR